MDQATRGLVPELATKRMTVSRPPIAATGEGEREFPLSRCELDIVALVAQGFLNVEIADELHISVETVQNHLPSVFKKLDVRDRLELALFAMYHK